VIDGLAEADAGVDAQPIGVDAGEDRRLDALPQVLVHLGDHVLI
jgi:hypothetical protein